MTLVLRSRTERLRVLRTLRAGLGGILVVTVLLATVLSYLRGADDDPAACRRDQTPCATSRPPAT